MVDLGFRVDEGSKIPYDRKWATLLKYNGNGSEREHWNEAVRR